MVSVIIPTLNCARFLPAALESAFAQTWRDVEVIVVDDGSTDNTDAVIQPYLPRVQYLRGDGRGPSAARNLGMRAARGEIFAFLDADDRWLPEKLERQVARFADPKVGLCYADCWREYEDGRPRHRVLESRPLAAEGWCLGELIQSGFIFLNTAVLRRACADDVGWWDESFITHEDREFWLRIARRWKLALVREPLGIYFQRSGSLTSREDLLSLNEARLWEKVLLDPPPDRTARIAAERALTRAYVRRATFLRSAGRRSEARSLLARAFRRDWRRADAWREATALATPEWVLRSRRGRPQSVAPPPRG